MAKLHAPYPQLGRPSRGSLGAQLHATRRQARCMHALDSVSSTSTACCWRAARRGRALARRGDGAEEGRVVGRALEVAQVRVRVAVGVAAHQAAQLGVRHQHHDAAAKPHLRPRAAPAARRGARPCSQRAARAACGQRRRQCSAWRVGHHAPVAACSSTLNESCAPSTLCRTWGRA